MKYNRALISRYLLVTMVSLLLYSFSYPSALQKEFEKDTTHTQLKENCENSEGDLMRSGSESLVHVPTFSTEYNFVFFQNFYDAILTVHFTQLKLNNEQFESNLKIYLHYLRLLI